MRTSTALRALLTILSLSTPVLTRQAPTSYCKCICFQNSTIIPLNSPPQHVVPPPFTPPQPSSSSSQPSEPQPTNNGDPEQQPSPPINDGDSQGTASIPNLARHAFDASYNTLQGHNIFNRADGDEGDENGDEDSGRKHHRTLTCSDCNRAFCLDYHLPICKGAKEEDVFTSCFQRDSVKDETVVLVFILLTASLLSWAVLKPYIDRFRGSSPIGAAASSYTPVALSSDGGDHRSNGHVGVGNSNSRAGLLRGGDNGSILPRTEMPYRDGDSDMDRRRNLHDRNDVGSIARQGGLNS